MKTNYFYNLENFIGLSTIKNKCLELNKIVKTVNSVFYRDNFISNPIAKYFYKSMILNGDNIYFDVRKTFVDKDWMYFKLTSLLINYLKNELLVDVDYKKELSKDLISNQRGKYIVRLNELIVAGFLKYLGFKISLNSSKQSGMPDVIALGDMSFSNEAKLYDDKELYLFEILNKPKIMKIVMKLLDNFPRMNLFIFVSKWMSQNMFAKELESVVDEFIKTGKSQKNESLWLMSFMNYSGDQGYLIDHSLNGSSVRFIPSIPADSSVEKLKESLNKAEEQFNKSKLDGIAWVTFPNSRGVNIVRRIIWQATDIPTIFVSKNLGIVLYDINLVPDLYSNFSKFEFGVDFLTSNNNLKNKINQLNFGKFLDSIFSSPTIYIS